MPVEMTAAEIEATRERGRALLSWRDLSRLAGVHADLVAVIELARPAYRFAVLEGLRSPTRQRYLVETGASKTMNSRHLSGHAVDIAPLDQDGQVSWAWPLYYPLAIAVKSAADQLAVPVEWGGDWPRFKDGPHWQLPWDIYP